MHLLPRYLAETHPLPQALWGISQGPGMQAFLITFHKVQAGCSILGKNIGLWIAGCMGHLCPGDWVCAWVEGCSSKLPRQSLVREH